MQGALGQLAGAAREGLLALSVGVGLGVMEAEADEFVGPKGNPTGGASRCVTATRPGR